MFATTFDGHRPALGDRVFVDPTARLIGRVTLGDRVSVWPGAVLRADEAEIVIGPGGAVLDLVLIEAPADKPVVVAEAALISHQACLHGARVEAGALVGIGAIILDGAVVGAGSLIGAGAVVPPGMVVPEGVLVLGQPAKVIRALKPAEQASIRAQVAELQAKAAKYLALPRLVD